MSLDLQAVELERDRLKAEVQRLSAKCKTLTEQLKTMTNARDQLGRELAKSQRDQACPAQPEKGQFR